MNETKTPRGLWINPDNAHVFPRGQPGTIHVIEMSAYESLLAQAKALADALDEMSTHLPGQSDDCHRVRDLCDQRLANWNKFVGEKK